MGDGSGGIGGSIKDAAKDIGNDITQQLGKDIFEQISAGKTTKSTTNDQNSQGGTSPQLKSVQRNIQIANLSKKIRMMKHRQVQVTNQVKQQEQQRVKTQDEERKQRYEVEKEKKGFGGKVNDIFANWGNTLARRGKGEQRGNKASG